MNPHANGGPLPPLAEPHAAQIADVEAEMDALWGPSRPKRGWRGDPPEAFGPPHLTVAQFRRMKWLLKRQHLLLRGLDWDVEIVTPDVRAPYRCAAVPVEPKAADVADDPRNPTAGPVSVWRPPPATVLAFELDMPVERVELALSRIPDAFKSDAGVRAWCATVGGAVAAAVRAGATPRVPEAAPPTSA